MERLIDGKDDKRLEPVQLPEGYEQRQEDVRRDGLRKEYGSFVGPKPNPDCLECGGIGWLSVEADEHQYKAIPCHAPDCLFDSFQRHQRGEVVMEKRGIRSEQTFENFHKLKGTKAAFDAARTWADARMCQLLIFGETGNGKTHLANAAAKKLTTDGHLVKFCHVPTLYSQLRASVKEDRLEEILAELREVQFLILDEYSYRTPWEQDCLDGVLGYRERAFKFTLITTNLELEEIPKRIRSRFSDPDLGMCVINEGKDYRLR